MKLLRRNISFLLIGILILQADGTLLINQLQQCFVQYQVRKGMKQNGLATEAITLPLADFQKLGKGKHEITLGGRLYDIKSLSIKDDLVTLYVIHDKAEEGIIKKIKDFFSPAKDGQGKIPKYVQKLLAEKYIPPVRHFFLELVVQVIGQFSFLELSFATKLPDILSPPPR